MTTANQRGYGRAYRQARAALLASNPRCHWCPEPATTADHEPPLAMVGYNHLNLVPACETCNKGRRGGTTPTHSSEPSREW